MRAIPTSKVSLAPSSCSSTYQPSYYVGRPNEPTKESPVVRWAFSCHGVSYWTIFRDHAREKKIPLQGSRCVGHLLGALWFPPRFFETNKRARRSYAFVLQDFGFDECVVTYAPPFCQRATSCWKPTHRAEEGDTAKTIQRRHFS